jgi:elongation factor G
VFDSGTFETGKTAYNPRKRKRERIGNLVKLHANKREEISAIRAGDIGAVVGMELITGDTLCPKDHPIILERTQFPEPVIDQAIEPKTKPDQDKLKEALKRLMQEDPSFRSRVDKETGQNIISGMAELHLDIYIERMRREYGMDVIVGAPQVNYREAITETAGFDYLHKKQTGGAGQFAGVNGSVEPLPLDNEEGFEFVNKIFGGSIPSGHVPDSEKGFRDVMEKGPLAAFPMVNVRVTLNEGKYHEVDSSDLAFQLASRYAMRQAVEKADPVLLEPVMKVEIETPSGFQGSVIGDLSSRRGVIYGTEMKGDETVINSGVPLGEMFGYATTLRSMTEGKANYTMEFEKYSECPKFVQEKLIKERQERHKENND